jgi:hypothetical protein
MNVLRLVTRLVPALVILACPSGLQAQAQPKFTHPGGPNPKWVPGFIVDEGLPDLRQLADANGDGLLDYCRFVGNAPDVFLSCQLGTSDGVFSKEPYGFNSIKGLDRGFPPRAMLDVNGDNRADFCRYIGDPQLPHLSCVPAESDGFSSEQYTDPSAFLARGNHLELVLAKDGTPISYVSDPAKGTWLAYGTDSQGTDWFVEGETSAKTPPNSGPGAIVLSNTGKRLRLLMENNKQIPKDQYALGRGIILNMSMGWSSTGSLDLRIAGNGGDWNPQTGYSHTQGFEYTKSEFSPSVGYRVVNLHVWDCEQRSNKSCDTFFGGKQFSDADKPVWDGARPEPLALYLPKQIDLMAYFGPLADKQTTEVDALVRTGVPWFDAGHWYEHSSADWGVIQSALTQDAKDRIARVEWVVELGKILSSTVGHGIGGVPGTVIGEVLGNVIFGWTGRQVMDAIADRDKEWCKSVNYRWQGCEQYKEKTAGDPQDH